MTCIPCLLHIFSQEDKIMYNSNCSRCPYCGHNSYSPWSTSVGNGSYGVTDSWHSTVSYGLCEPAYHTVSSEDYYRMEHNDARMEAESHKAERKEENGNMSFTGIVVTNDALIAFGDSKSTRKDAFGNMMKENTRQVRKVFRFDEHTLIAASGINMVHDKGITRCVENVIEDCINDEHTDILLMLERLSNGLKDIDGECNIFIGRKESGTDGRASLQEVFVNGSYIHFFQRRYSDNASIIKIRNNTPLFASHLDEAITLYEIRHTDYTTEDIMQLIEECIRADIERVEKEYDYCPVGLPVQFEVIEL